jgi:hypothetical protein
MDTAEHLGGRSAENQLGEVRAHPDSVHASKSWVKVVRHTLCASVCGKENSRLCDFSRLLESVVAISGMSYNELAHAGSAW